MKIGNRLKKFRMARNLTGVELGTLTGTGQSTISEIENNKRSPTIDTLEKICNVLKIKVCDLLEDRAYLSPEYLLFYELISGLSDEDRAAVFHFISTFKSKS